MSVASVVPETRCTVVVPCQFGLHMRVAGCIVEMARQFQSEICFISGNVRADAKSVIAMLLLAAGRGQSLVLTARGEDADQAVQALSGLFEAEEVLCQLE